MSLGQSKYFIDPKIAHLSNRSGAIIIILVLFSRSKFSTPHHYLTLDSALRSTVATETVKCLKISLTFTRLPVMDDHTITSWADRHMFREIRSASKNKELTLIALFWLLLLPRACCCC